MRAVIGILAGIIGGVAAIILLGIAGLGITFTPPAGLDATSSNQVLEAFENAPTAAKIAMMVAWFGGGLAGAALAKRIAGTAWAAWTVAGIIALYVLLNMLVLQLPGWMQVLSVAAPLLGGLFGNHLVRERAFVAGEEGLDDSRQDA